MKNLPLKKFEFAFPNEPNVQMVIRSPKAIGAELKAKILSRALGIDLKMIGEAK